jgi:hypothetical protein
MHTGASFLKFAASSSPCLPSSFARDGCFATETTARARSTSGRKSSMSASNRRCLRRRVPTGCQGSRDSSCPRATWRQARDSRDADPEIGVPTVASDREGRGVPSATRGDRRLTCAWSGGGAVVHPSTFRHSERQLPGLGSSIRRVAPAGRARSRRRRRRRHPRCGRRVRRRRRRRSRSRPRCRAAYRTHPPP